MVKDNIRVSAMLLPGLAAEFQATYQAEGMTLSEAIRAAVRDWVKARRQPKAT